MVPLGSVADGAAVTADFQLRLRVVGEQVTVSASGGEETSFNSIQSVTSLTAAEISERNTQSLGDVLDHVMLESIERSDVDLRVKRKILGANAARLLGL